MDSMSRHVFTLSATDHELAEAAAKRCLDRISVSSSGRPFILALSGGRIANQFFIALADLARQRASKLDAVHFFWADERCVPPTDPQSNFLAANQLLFVPLHIPVERVHRIRGELAADLAATEAAADLCRVAPMNEGGQPVLDLILLGMGEDGHVASLFPGEAKETIASPAVYRAVVASKPPPQRVTLGYPAIAAAREVWVLASGSGKEAALEESLRANGSTPLARVLKMRPRTEILTDIRLPNRKSSI